MAIINIAELYENKIENVEELYKKHQTNPNNNGVRVIDNIWSIDLETNKLVPGQLLTIRIAGKERTFRAEIKDIGIMYFGVRTNILTPNGFGSISDSTITPASKIAVYNGKTIEYKGIIALEEIYSMCTHYELRIKNKDNYILKNGIIIKAD